MKKLLDYLVLPTEISKFERQYLARMTKVGLWFFWGHLPVMVIVALLAKTDALRAAIYAAVALVGPTLATRMKLNPRYVTRVFAFTAMVLGGLLVHFGQGPMQIEMHFYFFVLIALLAVYADPLVIIVAAVTVALHHLVFYLLAPASVFNYDASVWAVIVHALFVVLESIAACFVARSFFDNVIGLERIVQARTNELAHRTEQMTMVLENVEQGLVIVHPDGTLGGERSANLEPLLGKLQAGDRLWDWVGRVDKNAGSWLEVGWTMLSDGFVPADVALGQLPDRIVSGGRVLALSYRPLATADFGGLLFVVTDVTSEAERERYESEQREMLVLFERVLKDRAGVLEFAAEGTEMIEEVTAEGVSLPVVKRLLHTLKGNSGIIGCGTLARLCHEIEGRVEEAGALSTSDSLELKVSWDHVKARLGTLIGDAQKKRFEIDPADHEAVLRTLREGGSRARAVEMMEDWTLEPTQIRLERLADQVRGLATRLGKGEIDVEIASHGLRLDPEPLRPFWASLLHVLRNATDHGLETPEDRIADEKPARGKITLATKLTEAGLIVEVSDDGRGIAWEHIRERAQAFGLPSETRADLIAALFADGVSTKETATEISGRGVGMSAVASECRDLGGTIDVLSVTGRGTTFRITLPTRVAGLRAPSNVRTIPSLHEGLRASA